MPGRRDPERDEPVSIDGIDFETALRGLLAVDPDSEPVSDDHQDEATDGDERGG